MADPRVPAAASEGMGKGPLSLQLVHQRWRQWWVVDVGGGKDGSCGVVWWVLVVVGGGGGACGGVIAAVGLGWVWQQLGD